MSRKTLVRGLTAVLMVAGLTLAGGSVAFAQIPGYSPTPTLSVDDTTVAVGQTVTASGTNWGAGETIKLSFNTPSGESRLAAKDSTALTSATADASGAFTATFVVPNVPDGLYTLTATGDTNSLGIDITVGNGSGGGSGSVGGLSRTGTNVAPLAGVGAAAIVLGAAAVYGTRRRRNESA